MFRRVSSSWRNGLVGALTICVIASASCFACRMQRQRQVRQIDERIVQETEQLLIEELRNLPRDSPITQRYGRFREITDARWVRPNYPWMLVVRLDYTAKARFEKAWARIDMGISGGGQPEPPEEPGAPRPTGEVVSANEPHITRLGMRPSTEWMRKNPQSVGEFEIIDGELWMIGPAQQGRGPCTLEAWATHPDFIHE